jgi:GT2 family glycosyltransferase
MFKGVPSFFGSRPADVERDRTNEVVPAPPPIDPLPVGTPRPFWSVMIPVYNDAVYLREALNSVLSQDPGPDRMQIEVIDNCSTKGDPQSVARELGGERVLFHRQPSNVGPVENFNACIRRAHGEWVHILHSDDRVAPGFYGKAWNGLVCSAEVGAALCRFDHIDENGDTAYYGRDTHLSALETPALAVLGNDFVERLLINPRIQYAAIVVRRSIYEKLGGFRPALGRCTDWDMWIRVALNTRILYEPQPYAFYRVHSSAESARLAKTGQDVADQRLAIRTAALYVPPQTAKRIYHSAMEAAAIEAIARARSLWIRGERTAALRQLREATRCSIGLPILLRLAYFATYAAGHAGVATPRTS